jgi:hypothetical protein
MRAEPGRPLMNTTRARRELCPTRTSVRNFLSGSSDVFAMRPVTSGRRAAIGGAFGRARFG